MSLTRDNKGFIFRSGPVKQTNFSSFWDDNNDNSLVDSFLGLDEEMQPVSSLFLIFFYLFNFFLYNESVAKCMWFVSHMMGQEYLGEYLYF